MNKIRNIIVALGVFAMMIGSSFAMDTNPPTEPVKTTVETVVVTDNLEKPTLLEEGYGYYDYFLDECVFIAKGSPGSDCSPLNDGIICVDLLTRDLYQMHFDETTNTWVCGLPLKKPIVN